MSTPPYSASPSAHEPAASAAPSTSPTEPSTTRISPVLATVGTGLLAAAGLFGSLYSRADGELDVSNYLVLVAATVGLLGLAAAGQVVVRDERLKDVLLGYPVAAGAIALVLAIGIGLETEDDVWAYVFGLLVLGVSAAGYVLRPTGATIVSGIAGLAVLYIKVIDDLSIFDGDGENLVMALAFSVFVFVVAVTAIGWFLPRHRAFTGVVVGAIVIASLATIGPSLLFLLPFLFGGNGGLTLGGGNVLRNDFVVTIILVLLLVALWSALHVVTGHIGFRVLALVAAATLLPLSVFGLILDRPSYAGAVLLLAGAAAAGYAVLRGRRDSTSGSGGSAVIGGPQPGQPGQPGQPYGAGSPTPTYGAPAYGSPPPTQPLQSDQPAYQPPPSGATGGERADDPERTRIRPSTDPPSDPPPHRS